MATSGIAWIESQINLSPKCLKLRGDQPPNSTPTGASLAQSLRYFVAQNALIVYPDRAVDVDMEVETKFVRLFKPAAVGHRIDGWRVCWVGGWDKCPVLFVVMVERPRPAGQAAPISLHN